MQLLARNKKFSYDFLSKNVERWIELLTDRLAHIVPSHFFHVGAEFIERNE